MLGWMSYKIGGRNVNNLRYVDDTTLMAESKEKLKRLLMRVKEENEKAGLSLRLWHLVPPLHGKGERVEATTDFLFLGSKSTADGDCSHEIRRQLLLGRKAMKS